MNNIPVTPKDEKSLLKQSILFADKLTLPYRIHGKNGGVRHLGGKAGFVHEVIVARRVGQKNLVLLPADLGESRADADMTFGLFRLKTVVRTATTSRTQG